jgi:hypothetical protein
VTTCAVLASLLCFMHCTNKVRDCIHSYGMWRYVNEYLVPGFSRQHSGLIFQFLNA